MKQKPHWSEMGEWGMLWGMRLLLRVYGWFGRGVLHYFLYPIVAYYWVVNKPGREASQAYLKRVAQCRSGFLKTGCRGGFNRPGRMNSPQHAPLNQEIMDNRILSQTRLSSFRHFFSFADAIIDKWAAWSGALSLEDVAYRGRDDLLAEISRGRGVVLLGSHLGNLEVCRVIADLNETIRINALVHTKHAEKFNRLLKQANPKSGLNLIQVTEINAATAMLLSDKIDQGELVIIAADRTPIGQQKRVSRVRFLGEDALFPEGPFILASLLKCPVYTLFCLKQYDQHVIYFDHFSDGLVFPKKNRGEALQQTIQNYAGRLAHYCLMEPLQWFNFFDFWRLDED